MSRALGGRSKSASRAAPIARPKLAPAPAIGFDPCVTETFDTADSSTLGPDRTWIVTDQDATSGTTTPHVRDDALTISHTSGVTRAAFVARAEADCNSADMNTEATITALATMGSSAGEFLTIGFGVWARMISFPGDGGGNAADPTSFVAGKFVGWHFFVSRDDTDSFGTCDFLYYDPSGPTLFDYPTRAQIAFTTLGAPIATDDVPSITVTGTGTDTRVVCKINTTTVFDLDYTDISGVVTGSLLSEAMNSTGQRGGLTLFASVDPGAPWSSSNDDVIRLDDFHACPA